MTTQRHSDAQPSTLGDGALLIDKPAGITSHGVIARLRRAYPGVRFGHAGTLDPDATGLLLVLTGKATRFQDVLLNSTKEYEGEVLLGVRTDTDDASGARLSEDSTSGLLSDESQKNALQGILEAFSGSQMQVPPQVSAVQVGGVRSYAAVRAGKALRLEPRKVWIEFLSLSFLAEDRLQYHIRCSKGTYVRALARDIGELLGCGAVAGKIRRVASGAYLLAEARGLDETLEGGFQFVPLERLVETLPALRLSASECSALACGQQELLANYNEELSQSVGEYAVIFNQEGQLTALLRQEAASKWRLAYVLSR